MEGTLERKQKLQLGGKKVKRDSFGVKAWKHSTCSCSYLPSTGSLQRLELLPRHHVQTHLGLLPEQEQHTEG